MTGGGIVTAGGGHAWETALVAEIGHGGGPYTIVRRCADMADVLAMASTGQVAAAVVAADLRRLDSETVFELAALGVAVVGVYRAADERLPVVLERIGVATCVPDDATPAALVTALRSAMSADRPTVRPAAVGADPDRSPSAAAPGTALKAPSDEPGDPDGPREVDEGWRVEPGNAPGAPHSAPTTAPGGRSFRRLVRTGARRSAHRAGRARGDATARPDGPRGGIARRGDGSESGNGAPRRGRVVAVWGPMGAPGRSTVTLGLADRAVASGSDTLLIDADVYGGVLANALGLLDESAGLAGACRLASGGRLGQDEFARLCWRVRDGLTVLTGISRADRWPEVRPSAIPTVLEQARALADVVVVDCSPVVEADEEITFDTLAPRRNGATLAMLAAADVVIAVGSADPPGIERLARGLAELLESIDGLEPRVVFNRVRPTAASLKELRDASLRFCGRDPVAYLPEDRPSTDLAWRRGVTLSMVTTKSPLISAFDELAAAVIGVPRR